MQDTESNVLVLQLNISGGTSCLHVQSYTVQGTWGQERSTSGVFLPSSAAVILFSLSICPPNPLLLLVQNIADVQNLSYTLCIA